MGNVSRMANPIPVIRDSFNLGAIRGLGSIWHITRDDIYVSNSKSGS